MLHFTVTGYLLFCTYLVTGAPSLMNLLEIGDRIMGGVPVNISNFPYQLSLEYQVDTTFKHNCGASILSTSWIITAAHCVYGIPLKKMRFRSGTSFREREGNIHEISEVITHPQYTNKALDYDVALIKVSPSFHYSDVVQPITLAHSTPSAGTAVVVSGWGSLTFGGSSTSQLHKVVVNVVDHDKCVATYDMITSITSRMLCAGVPQGQKDACKGDSGGPLVTAGKQLVGIVSWGVECGVKDYPGIYTDVAYLRNWILFVTAKY